MMITHGSRRAWSCAEGKQRKLLFQPERAGSSWKPNGNCLKRNGKTTATRIEITTKNNNAFWGKNVPRSEARSRALRNTVVRAMCRFCDAIGPLCPWVTGQDWFTKSTVCREINPPSPDDLLSLEPAETSVSSGAIDGAGPVRTTRPKAASRRKLKFSPGTTPP